MTKNEPVVEEASASLTIKEWCQQEGCCLATFHKLTRTGRGPKTLRIGRFVRVIESKESWHRRMAEMNATSAARRQKQRRIEMLSRAGKLAVASPRHVSKRQGIERAKTTRA
jgi:predicted DNA-binding transcriptional regulator AlpA